MMSRVGAILTLLLFIVGGASSQTYPPVVQYESLMNMRFYEARGGFLVEDIQLVFPTALSTASLVVKRPDGSVAASVPLRYEAMEFPAFGRFRPASGETGLVEIGKPGNYVMSVIAGGKTLTEMRFTIAQENSTDPFAPGSRFVRSGPWSEYAFLSVVPNDPDGQLTLNWWTSTRELPAGMKRPNVTLHLMSNGKEISATQGAVVPDTMDWSFYHTKQLSVPGMPRAHWMTLGDLQKLNGDVSLVLKANGTPFKTYKLKVTGGQVERLPDNALDYEPHTAFISPRYIDTTSGTNSRYKMYEMYWLRAAK